MDWIRNLPKASANYDFFCAFIGLMEILEKRGYIIPATYVKYTNKAQTIKNRFETYSVNLAADKKRHLSVPFVENFSLKPEYVQISTYPPTLLVCILDAVTNDTHIKDLYNKRCEDKKGKGKFDVLAVYNTPKDEKKYIGNGTLEIMCYQQLLINPMHHSRAPLSITVLSQEDKDILLNSEALEGKKLVIITKTDPVCLFLDAQVGDVLKYVDAKVYTKQGLSTVEYKMVQ